MSTSHRSTAYVKPIAERGRTWKPNPITSQFRFIVRMAVACHDHQVPYDLAWAVEDRRMRATITAAGRIPTPRALPKPPKPKLVSDWKPAIWDAEYRLKGYYDASLKRMRPGFVIGHSCGLSLVHPSESGELGVTEHGADEDIRSKVVRHAYGVGPGIWSDAEFQARRGCALARGIVRSRLDAGRGRVQAQYRVPPIRCREHRCSRVVSTKPLSTRTLSRREK